MLKFKVMGKLRYLSHRESMSVFERALIRSDIDLYFTQGFNPRPKVSLPLPRSVGLASADDMFCAELICNGNSVESVTEKMGAQLPDGFEITGAELIAGRVRPQPVKAAYGFRFAGANEGIQERVEDVKGQIASGGEMLVTRTGGKGKMPRQINVLPFIESVDYADDEVCVWCNISGGGTVRVEELVEILEIDKAMLSEPITRKQTIWKTN